MQESEALIHTKLRPPFIRADLVPRPRLQKRVARGLRGPLTLITAPAGFGKTTLAASCVVETGMSTAWLSLGSEDDRSERFLIYLVTALRQTDAAIGDEAIHLLATGHAPPREILISLVNNLETAGEEIILVLDDYQFIKNQDVHQHVAFLLEHCPSTLHLVIATRSDPPLPLARLRVRNQLVEVRAADLRFAAPEATQFLNDIMGLDLDAGSIATLEARTEGWIAGLQMAALSLRGRPDSHEFIEGFSGTNRYVLDYLLEEVLAGQTSETQRFLLHTSILERLSVPLCEALLQQEEHEPPSTRSQAASILADLEQKNLFVVPLDDERRWYRYHHLFADLLRARLPQTLSNQEIVMLHTRAARWYENNGLAHAAVHHASLTSDHAWVERLIEQNYMEMFQRRDSSSIRLWTADVDREEIFKRPRLSLHEAMWRSWTGQLDVADIYLNEAEKRIQQLSSDTDTRAMLGHLAYVRSRVIAMRGNVPRAIELSLLARDYTPSSNQALLGGIGVMLGYAYYLHGDLVKAIQVLDETIQTGVAVGAINSTMGAYCVLARLYAIQGKLHRARDLYREAEVFASTAGDQDLGVKGLAGVGLADLYYEWNDLEQAFNHVKQGMAYIPYWSKADDMVLATTTLARIQQAQGETTLALETIEKGTQLIHTRGIFSEAHQALVTTDMRLRLAQGDIPTVNRWARSIEARPDEEQPYRFENELTHLTLARAYIAQQQSSRALELLAKLAVRAESGARTGRLIEILNLEALAKQALGDQTAALATIARSLALAEPEGYARLFLDEGQPMRMLLTQWLARADTAPQHGYAAHLLDHFDAELAQTTEAQEANAANGDLIEPLSSREREVLDLIALGLTNKEIAERLFVAPGTIKAHSSNIYRKLDVGNRTEGVARARELGILT